MIKHLMHLSTSLKTTSDRVSELEECLVELTKYMTRDQEFEVPANSTELCGSAKQFIVSNHAVILAELDTKHMFELDECKVCVSSFLNLYTIESTSQMLHWLINRNHIPDASLTRYTRRITAWDELQLECSIRPRIDVEWYIPRHKVWILKITLRKLRQSS